MRLPKLVIVGMALALVAMSCSNDGATQEALDRSSDPVMLPDLPFLNNAKFTIYENWTDLYELRYNQNIGQSANFTALQFSAGSLAAQGSDGPGNQVVARAKAAVNSPTCVVVHAETALRHCVHEGQSYLIRTFTADGQELTVVANYFDNPSAALGEDTADASVFNPDSIEGLVMTTSFSAVASADAQAHLEVVN